jgi:hypothetical protein
MNKKQKSNLFELVQGHYFKFIEWEGHNEYYFDKSNNRWILDTHDDGTFDSCTTDELYERWLIEK